MAKPQPLPYLPAMFATCMLFQVLYVACIVSWSHFPDLPGHAAMINLFPQFKLLDVPSFIEGLVLSMIYGWVVAATFVFFYNLWPRFASVIFGRKTVTQ
jgi:hypothetical protein